MTPCTNHWHCDPATAAHACDKPDRRKPCPQCGALRSLSAWLSQAHIHGLSDRELRVLERLVRSADEWQGQMGHCHDANNVNGALHRAVDAARATFGPVDGFTDPHRFCNWKCVAHKNYPRCDRDQPTVICSCGIESPKSGGACTSCKKVFDGV